MDQCCRCICSTIPLLDPQAPDYALILLTVVESIPKTRPSFYASSLDQVKDRKDGGDEKEAVEYDERMEELEKLEHPKPNREFHLFHLQQFCPRASRGWARNIRPKSMRREMFEEFRSFADYIKLYELHRAEGCCYANLNSVFKVLAQTVPDTAKNDQIHEMELYLAR